MDVEYLPSMVLGAFKDSWLPMLNLVWGLNVFLADWLLRLAGEVGWVPGYDIELLMEAFIDLLPDFLLLSCYIFSSIYLWMALRSFLTGLSYF